jgi:hypothetical protein
MLLQRQRPSGREGSFATGIVVSGAWDLEDDCPFSIHHPKAAEGDSDHANDEEKIQNQRRRSSLPNASSDSTASAPSDAP